MTLRDAEQAKDQLIEQLCRELAQAKQSEERFKAFMENSPTAKWMKDAQGRYVCINRAFEKRFGVRLEDCCGKTDSELWPPEVAEALSENDSAVLKSNRAMDMVRDAHFPGEKRFTWYDFKFPFEDSSGNRFVCGVGLDITSQKQIARELLLKEVQFQTLYGLSRMSQASEQEIIDFVLEQQIRITRSKIGFLGILDEKAKVSTVYGWSKDLMKECEVVDKPVHFPVDSAGLWAQAVRERRTVIVNDYGAPNPHKKGYPKGHAPLHRVMSVPVFHGDRMVAISVVGNKEEEYEEQDARELGLLIEQMWRIIQQRKFECSLQESERRYRELVQYANSAIIRWKSDGTITFFNEYAQSFFGYPEDEAIGRSADILLPDRQSNEADMTCLMQGILHHPEQYVHNINENVCRDGRRVWMAWTNRAILDRNGEVAEVLAVGTDITDRKRAEDALSRARDELEVRVQERTAELERANQKLRAVPSKLIAAQEEEKRKLAAELHDSVSQTLAALKYGIEVVLAKRSKGFTEEAFGDLDRFVPLLQRSIEETRAIYMSLKPTVLEDMGLIAAMQWLKRQFQRLNPGCHIELEMDISEREISEPLRLTIFRIVQESLNNVAKHSSAEWVDLSLSKNGRGIEFMVRDDGIGMDVSYLMQSNHARCIGLESMRERSELTGGIFTIESVLGEGSTIRVVWPSEPLAEKKERGNEKTS